LRYKSKTRITYYECANVDKPITFYTRLDKTKLSLFFTFNCNLEFALIFSLNKEQLVSNSASRAVV